MSSQSFTESTRHHRIDTEVLHAVGLERRSIRGLPRHLVDYLIRLGLGSKRVARKRGRQEGRHLTERTLKAVQDLRAHRKAIEDALAAAERDADPGLEERPGT